MADKNQLQPPNHGHGHEYDPRRLYPFGLSPIPELPSGLASEVSSVCSYSPTPSDEFADDSETDEECRSRSIMYSGSCSSVKSVEEVTVAENLETKKDHEDDDDDEETDTDESSTEQDSSTDDSETDVETEDEFTDEDDKEPAPNEGQNLYSSQVMTVTHQKTFPHEIAQESNLSEELKEDLESKDEAKGGHQTVTQDLPICPESREISQPVSPSQSRPTSSQELSNEDTTKALYNATAAGAATASEIFRHLQATRGKEEVTQELAKILNVLQTTLKHEDSESSTSSDSSDSSDTEEVQEKSDAKAEPSPESKVPTAKAPLAPLGKPPRHPNVPILTSRSGHDVSNRIGPEIQQRIKELGAVKPGSGKEEMNILSKILVTLLCSCKTASASGELKKIIKQFKDAAKEASDEVGDDLDKISKTCSRTSSRSSNRRRRKARSRRSSANSSNSHSEAESLTNTLTPCNTDSKSSGTEDEGIIGEKGSHSVPRSSNTTPVAAAKLQFKVVVDDGTGNKVNEKQTQKEMDHNVSVTISLPRQEASNEEKGEEDEEDTSDTDSDEDEENAEYDDNDEWEWEEDEDAAQPSRPTGEQSKRHDSTCSSHEISLAEEKSAAEVSNASSTTRKLLTDMECGAYNSDSLCSPGHSGHSDMGNSEQEQSSHISPGAGEEDSESDSTAEWLSGDEQGRAKQQNEQPLVFTHLKETFNVLNGAYKIITGSIQEEEYIQEQNKSGSFVSSTTSATVQPVVVSRSSMSCSATIDKTIEVKQDIKQQAQSVEHLKVPGSRPQSRQLSRPVSRQRVSRPSSKMSVRAASRQSNRDGNDEEDWGDSDEWEYEYYYEDEEEEEEEQPVCNTAVVATKQKVEFAPDVKNVSSETMSKTIEVPTQPKERIIPIVMEAGPANGNKNQLHVPPPESRPGSRQRRLVSRPNSRSGSRPASRNGSRPVSRACSRMSMKMGLDGVREEDEYGDDWEWEYYYEGEEEELQCMSPTLTTAPTTRATSPFPNGGEKLREERQVQTPMLSNAIEMTSSPNWEEAGRVSVLGVPLPGTASEMIHNDMTSQTKEMSVVLAAEYLGQTAEDVAAALPAGFADNVSPSSASKLSESGSHTKKKKHKKHKKSKDESDIESGEKRKKKRKPRVSVKQLVDKLEPKLFQDAQTGTKMVMNENAAKSAIQSSKFVSSGKQEQASKPVSSLSDQPPDPMNAKFVGRVLPDNDPVVVRDAKNPNQMQVIQGGQATIVNMRQKVAPDSPKSVGTRRKVKKPATNSPSESSEAYGTGSTTSEGTEDNNGNGGSEDVEDSGKAGKHGKDGSERHSRLFRLLQDSDYTDSELESGMQSPALVHVMDYGNVPKTVPNSFNQSGLQTLESDLDSLGSMKSIERKHSFRSIKSSGNESEGDSSASGANKVSPPSMRRDMQRYAPVCSNIQSTYDPTSSIVTSQPVIFHQQQMQQMQHQYHYQQYHQQQQQQAAFPMTPSSSEVSSPSSPTFAFAPCYSATSGGNAMSSAKPKASPRVWSYLNTEFSPPTTAMACAEEPASPIFQHHPQPPSTQTMFSTTADYSSMQQTMQQQQQQYADSLEVETIMSRGKVQRPSSVVGLSNAATASPANTLLRQKKLPSPMTELMRNSPTYRNSPRLDMELMDLAHLPPAPTLKVHQQRSSYHQQQTSASQSYTTQYGQQQQPPGGLDRKL